VPVVEKPVKSWEPFVDLRADWDVSMGVRPSRAFRGHANSGWQLTHTLYRMLTQDGFRLLPSTDKALEFEWEATRKFKAEAHIFIPITTLATTKDDASWWCVMQHHGAPTRLIEWTASPYVGVYVAVVSHPSCDGALYVLDINTLGTAMQKLYGEQWDIPLEPTRIDQYFRTGPPSVCYLYRQTQTDRMVIQQSFFTACRNILANQDEVLTDPSLSHDQSGELLSKYIIPASLKAVFVRRLRTMNISAATLFPGIDGIGRSIGELIKTWVEVDSN
jgi:FRG domain